MELLKHFLQRNFRLGLRIIKTGIAVTLCVLVTRLLKLDSPFIIAVAAVLAMGKSIDSSFKAGAYRMLGVCFGVGVGLGFAMIGPGNMGLCGIGVILTLYLCQVFRLHDSSTIACLAFFVVMMNLNGAPPWQGAWDCLVDTFLGIVIALLVNLLIMPPNMAGKIREIYLSLCELMKETVRGARTGSPGGCRAIAASLEELELAERQYVQEVRFLRGRDEEVFAISCRLPAFREALHELTAIEMLGEAARQDSQLGPVYEYHMGRLEKLLEQITLPAVTPKKQSGKRQ